jgi:hypothetical protein
MCMLTDIDRAVLQEVDVDVGQHHLHVVLDFFGKLHVHVNVLYSQ